MKFLLDMPVSSLLLDVSKAHGHEGVHAHEIGMDRATDNELLETALIEGRILITADLDFPRLLALSLSEPPGLILVSRRELLRYPNVRITGESARSCANRYTF